MTGTVITFRHVAALAGIKLAVLVAVAVPVLTALVEELDGQIRLVNIGEGRAVLSGAPGTLLAVCERPPSADWRAGRGAQ